MASRPHSAVLHDGVAAAAQSACSGAGQQLAGRRLHFGLPGTLASWPKLEPPAFPPPPSPLQVNGRYIKKRIHVRIEHVTPSRCHEEFLRRCKENDEARHAAKVAGTAPPSMKRQPKGPRTEGFTLENVKMETITREHARPLLLLLGPRPGACRMQAAAPAAGLAECCRPRSLPADVLAATPAMGPCAQPAKLPR